MRVFIHTSGWAVWSAGLARPVIPLLLIAAGLHYVGYLPSPVFVTLIAVGIILSLLALACAIIAYIKIWYSGDAGWRLASSGLVFGLIAIGFLVYLGQLGSRFEQTIDVTTAQFELPLSPKRPNVETDPGFIDEDNFPSARTRQYQLPIELVTQAIINSAGQFGWTRNGARQLADEDKLYFFQAKTLLGFIDDITINIEQRGESVRVDMRSASRFGVSDLGKNSQRIADYLMTLDAETVKLRERAIAQ